jgi:lipopolysaccharide export system permease protein
MDTATRERERSKSESRRPAGGARRFAGFGRFGLKTMDLYVARTFLATYAACAASFIGLFIVVEAFAKLDRFLKQEGSFIETLLRYSVAMIPTVFTNYMGPILTSAAAMFTLTLLNRHNEIAPLKASGVSIYRILAPIFFFAAVFIGFTFYLQEIVLPRFREPIRTALALSHARPLNPDPYYDAQNGLAIKVREYSTTRKIARGIEVIETHPNQRIKRQTDANQMEWIATGGHDGAEGYWLLHDGSIQRWDESGNLITDESASSFERLKRPFTKMRLETSLKPIDLETSDTDISYLSWAELKTQYQRQPYHRHLAVKLHHHFAFPLAHILLLLLGVPFVINFQNRSVFLGLAASFAIGASFHLVSSICFSIANDSVYFSPALAAWLPIMLFGALGLTLFDHLPT